MNAAFRVGETQLMADDGMGAKESEFKGMTLAIKVADDDEARRVFTALGERGKSNHAFDENILDFFLQHVDRQGWGPMDGECGGAKSLRPVHPQSELGQCGRKVPVTFLRNHRSLWA